MIKQNADADRRNRLKDTASQKSKPLRAPATNKNCVVWVGARSRRTHPAETRRQWETSKRDAAQWCCKLKGRDERRVVKYTPLPPLSASFYHLTNEWVCMGGASTSSIHRNLHCFHASADADGGARAGADAGVGAGAGAGATDDA